MPSKPDRPYRVVLTDDGPLLVPGPVEVTLDDGTVVASSRFAVAICMCRRSSIPPWCDASHRRTAGPCRTRHEEEGTAS
ncbi:CDGSH iron-sulfur domain-containing protein [Streptomyces sp. NPDC005708]|uniref:CDGSH iron-sulfur domain-containing protein n=1 Tax=unclassified Streptomyces TaxID=2593676 RepID=UPI0033CAE722